MFKESSLLSIATPESRLLSDLEDLMCTEYRSHRPITYYCKALGITSGVLNNMTVAHYGKTVHELLQDKLLLAAMHLLSNSLMSVKFITYELGFQDPAYFTRWFKRVAGCTPKLFRRTNYGLKVWVW